jgi:hypothetical protein
MAFVNRLLHGAPGHPAQPAGGWFGGKVVFVHGMRFEEE